PYAIPPLALGATAYASAASPKNNSATGRQFAPASSSFGSEADTPAVAAPAQVTAPARSDSAAAAHAASASRPPSHRTRPTGRAGSVSRRSSSSSRRAPPTCAQANRLTASTKKKKTNER